MELNLLAFETSSARCGVALLRERGGSAQITLLEHDGSQEHAERLLPMARQLLDEAGLAPPDLHAVAFGQGPGGFTGLRVACGVAQGVALGLGVPVVPVASLLAVAEAAGAGAGDAVLVALDARMEEVYLAVYTRADAGPAGWRCLQAPLLVPIAEVMPWAQRQLPGWRTASDAPLGLLLAGDAWQAYPALGQAGAGLPMAASGRPRADSVARLAHAAWARGETVAPEHAAPLYVRDKVAYTTAEREAGQGGNPRAASALARPALQPMGAADLDDVAALEGRVQAFPWTRGNFTDALEAGYPACVARDTDGLAGFCVAMVAPDVVHLLVIAVAPERHRRGLGTRLIEWCELQAAARGVEGVMLEVRPSNEGAVRFYEHLGFLRIGVRKGYYPAGQGKREDALVMRKTISAKGPA